MITHRTQGSGRQQDFVRYRLHLLGAIQQDPVRIGTFHWEHPLFFNFFGQELFYFSIARSGRWCNAKTGRKGSALSCPLGVDIYCAAALEAASEAAASEDAASEEAASLDAASAPPVTPPSTTSSSS